MQAPPPPAGWWRLTLLHVELVQEAQRAAACAPAVRRIVSSSSLPAAPSAWGALRLDGTAPQLPPHIRRDRCRALLLCCDSPCCAAAVMRRLCMSMAMPQALATALHQGEHECPFCRSSVLLPSRRLVEDHPDVLTDDIASRFLVGGLVWCRDGVCRGTRASRACRAILTQSGPIFSTALSSASQLLADQKERVRPAPLAGWPGVGGQGLHGTEKHGGVGKWVWGMLEELVVAVVAVMVSGGHHKRVLSGPGMLHACCPSSVFPPPARCGMAAYANRTARRARHA